MIVFLGVLIRVRVRVGQIKVTINRRNKSGTTFVDNTLLGISVPSSEDPFSKLPREIADAILQLVNPVDVAALRIAGIARFLAIENWYYQRREEMPWLWEVWDIVLPSCWATTTVSTLCAEERRKEKAERQKVTARDIIQEEIPDTVDSSDMENAKGIDSSYAMCGNEGLKETVVLPKDVTDWCQVYYDVKMN